MNLEEGFVKGLVESGDRSITGSQEGSSVFLGDRKETPETQSNVGSTPKSRVVVSEKAGIPKWGWLALEKVICTSGSAVAYSRGKMFNCSTLRLMDKPQRRN
jgi:hypothetical protein